MRATDLGSTYSVDGTCSVDLVAMRSVVDISAAENLPDRQHHPQQPTQIDWWRQAVVYQIYPRSFMDGNGDGVGDLAGITERLPYLHRLGIDAIWFTPWYLSPFSDGGYDVSDYRQIDPRFGTLDDAEELIRQASNLGIRTIVDIVPNHVSNQHPWFQEALASPPGSPQRARFWFHDGRGDQGQDMPTNWLSSFRGPTWTRTTNPDGSPGQWYLHLFTGEQPDLNWDNQEVRAEHQQVLRFWFDRGAAGVRVDSAALIVKDPALIDFDESQPTPPGQHPFLDRDGIHDIYRSWRQVADTYTPPRILVGEVWLDDPARFTAYLRPDEMHTAFNFDFMTRPWDPAQLRQSIEATLAAHAPPTWVLANHDITRPVTRYGRAETGFSFADKRHGTPTDLALGTRRARAAFMLCAGLPGSLYIYQGDELGLPEDEELPLDAIEDPMYFRSGGVDPGRDGCRVPLPWTEQPQHNFGFSSPRQGDSSTSWLPQPSWWGRYAVQRQEEDVTSMLAFYRRVVALRRDLSTNGFRWLDNLPPTCLGFSRGPISCLVNFGPTPVRAPAGQLLLTSGPTDPDMIGPDTAVWVRGEVD